MKRIILISEVTEDKSMSDLFHYDALPDELKGLVDIALKKEGNFLYYTKGQYKSLPLSSPCQELRVYPYIFPRGIPISGEYLGSVCFYSK